MADDWPEIVDDSMSDEDRRMVEAHEHRVRVIQHLRSGQLTAPIQVSIRLDAGETAYYDSTSQWMEKQTVAYHSRQTSVSFGFAVTDDAALGVGSSSGKMVPEIRTVAADRGRYIATTERAIFAGSQNFFALPWADVVDLQLNDNSLFITSQSYQRVFRFTVNDPEIAYMVTYILWRQK